MKLPAFQFYPGDWRKDAGVQALSFHDRGIWFEIMCLMHESERRGLLILNGKAMPGDALARVLGLPIDELNKAVARLLEYGVASRDSVTSALMCRRMVRDEDKRQGQIEDGKKGGNPALCANYNRPGFVYAVQRSSDGSVKIGMSENPSKRLYRLRYLHKGQSLEMLGFAQVADMGKAEAELHSKYHYRTSGDWFALKHSEVADLVSALKGQPKVNQTPSSSSSASANNTLLSPAGGVEMNSLPTKTADQLRAEKLLKRRHSTNWSKSELRAWTGCKAIVEMTTEPDWQLLEWFHSRPVTESTFRRMGLSALLNNWSDEISRAAAYRGKFEHEHPPGGSSLYKEV